MLFSITWRLLALVLVMGIMIELASFGRDLMNMPSDVMMLLGVLLNVVTVAFGIWAVVLIMRRPRFPDLP